MPTCPLHQLPKGNLAYIQEIVANTEFGELDLLVTRRLSDLGFLPNTPIKIIFSGWLGKGPYAIQLDHHIQFSLRQAEAKKILCVFDE